jgi:predicted small lipoprotein YifL
MLREIAATVRLRAAAHASRRVTAACAIFAAAVLLAGCGIKGPLKPPPAAAPSEPAAVKPAPDHPAPDTEGAKPEKP